MRKKIKYVAYNGTKGKVHCYFSGIYACTNNHIKIAYINLNMWIFWWNFQGIMFKHVNMKVGCYY